MIDADAQVRDISRSAVKARSAPGGATPPSRPPATSTGCFVGAKIFADDARRRLEQLLHPMVKDARVAAMRAAAGNPQVPAFVWDTPLLFEAGLNGECDAIVYVDAPFDARLSRVRDSRGWDEAELQRRQNLQWPLDKKREMSDHRVTNTADVGMVRDQVRQDAFPNPCRNVDDPRPSTLRRGGTVPPGHGARALIEVGGVHPSKTTPEKRHPNSGKMSLIERRPRPAAAGRERVLSPPRRT